MLKTQNYAYSDEQELRRSLMRTINVFERARDFGLSRVADEKQREAVQEAWKMVLR